jgi:DNA polymerase-3 subunit epsilon
VCEIALLRVYSNTEIARFETLIHPQRPMGAGAVAVNGIRDDMLTGAPRFAAVLPRVETLFQSSVLVAHNAPFDTSFLQHEFRLAGRHFPSLPSVDTLTLAQAHYRFPHNSLAAIAETLGIRSGVRHRAMADVLTTWQVLQRFIADMHRRGPVTLAHLMYPTDARTVAELVALHAALQRALQNGMLLHLRYQGGNATETTRVVQPLELYHERGRGYLRAFCHLRQDERHFRFDRIRELRVLSETPRSDWSAE